MTCRIERLVTDDNRVIFSVSGRIGADDLDILRDLFAAENRSVVAVDLKDVVLVDRDAVRFLADSEANGIELRNCPPYVREWVAREKAQPNSDPSKKGPEQ